jgi:hypothetical protein
VSWWRYRQQTKESPGLFGPGSVINQENIGEVWHQFAAVSRHHTRSTTHSGLLIVWNRHLGLKPQAARKSRFTALKTTMLPAGEHQTATGFRPPPHTH